MKKQKKYTSTSRTSAVIRRLCAAIVITSAVAVAAPLLTSCSMIPGYAEPEDQAVVTAIGFDVDGELLTVTVQLSEAGGEEIRAISGTGRSIDAAISAISASETRTLEVSHLAIVALGRGVDRSWFEGIVDFCKRNEEIPISAMLVSTSDARALLSLPDTSGYKLTGIITSERESTSLGVEARLYKVLNTILSDDPVFFLPHFASNGDGFELYGGKIFRGGEPLTLLDRTESAYYLMIRGLFDRGAFGGNAPGLSGSVGISDCITTYVFSTDAEGLRILVKTAVTLDSEVADKKYADKITLAAKENMKRIYERLYSLHGDVFGLLRAAKKRGVDVDGSSGDLRVSFECTVKGE